MIPSSFPESHGTMARQHPDARTRRFMIRLFVLLVPTLYFSLIAVQVSRKLTSSGTDDYNADGLHVGAMTQKVSSIGNETNTVRRQWIDVSSCFPQNSIEWLDSKKHGNSNDNQWVVSFLDDLSSHRSGSSLIHSALRQSLCYEQSPLLNLNDNHSSVDEARRIRLWAIRLIYMVLYEHQHRPALQEARVRSVASDQCLQMLNEKGVGSFDFECPTAKFLVVSLTKNGIGANMRLGAVPAFEAGLASDRIVVFVDHAETGPSFLRETWPLASCDFRHDSQCFFRSVTPCVLTITDLASAYTLQKGEARQLFRHGRVPASRMNDRVLIVRLNFRPQREPSNLSTVLYNRSVALIERVDTVQEWPRAVLYKAAELVRSAGDSVVNETTYNYYGSQSLTFQSLLLYAMRPNSNSSVKLDFILNHVISEKGYFKPDESIGLPIRASDKCGAESECLPFDQYMTAAIELWYFRSVTASIPEIMSVIVTSESKDVLAQQAAFAVKSHDAPFRVQFVTNDLDTMQGTGYITEYLSGSNGTSADEAMLSAMSSLKMQLLATLSVGNCCSNFHLVLKDLLDAGCGASYVNSFQCLQDHPNPEFRICCSWDSSPRCQARRYTRNVTSYAFAR